MDSWWAGARYDPGRAEFIKHHFQAEGGDQTRHDLIIKLDLLSASSAADVILSAQKVLRGDP
ncbi:MAG: hypothetical protein PVI86_13505 [Phycisphaerae bacterium]